MNKSLFQTSERGRFYVKYNSDGILRGDLKTRYEAYRLALLAGWKTINEVRDLEDLEPLEGGDELPRPAAIWGKDDPGYIDDDDNDQRIDPRLHALTTQTVRGLFHRESVALQRMLSKPAELRSAVESFYDKHAGIVAEKLGPVSRSREPLQQFIASHREQVRKLIEDTRQQELPEELTRLASDWEQSASQVAKELLLISYQKEG